VVVGPLLIDAADKLYDELTKEEGAKTDDIDWGNIPEDNTWSPSGHVRYKRGSARIDEKNSVITADIEFSAANDSAERINIETISIQFSIDKKENGVYYISLEETVEVKKEDGTARFRLEKGYKAQYSNNNNDDLWEEY
jgi:hypothetical protein